MRITDMPDFLLCVVCVIVCVCVGSVCVYTNTHTHFLSHTHPCRVERVGKAAEFGGRLVQNCARH